MTTREMLSVGIDVGTTTSQLVVSRLSVANRARAGTVPRMDVESREVLYQGEPALTPLSSDDAIDVEALVEVIRSEYEAAGIRPEQVETGAVIITGETARTRNAEAILAGLSDLAGDFVVTVAGPHIESQIAGRGSGAAEWSARHYATIVNVDIGGGSANAAVFRNGRHLGSSAAMVGGRQAVIDPGTGTLVHLKHAGRELVRAAGLPLSVGQRVDLAALRQFTDLMAEITVDLVLGRTSPLGDLVALTGPLQLDGRPAGFFVSGGVGAAYYENLPTTTVAEVARFGDVGPLLAQSLKDNSRWRELVVHQPVQTQRATVLGAASQQVTLSGSTIWAEDDHLPLRNLPVVEPVLADAAQGLDDPQRVRAALVAAVRRWDAEQDHRTTFALSLDLPERMQFAQLSVLAQGLVGFAADTLPAGQPLVLVIEEDYAQVLGQTIRANDAHLPIIVVDQIGLDEGDFIDIGEPLFDGRVVPVSVKTLVFYQ
ncbi:ethanolamine ammonia-lyase reactivating factor EutA [Aestuariimicrobium sp. Y1814]|uniref:ethanolamine ammonia-lyase reactivating factor EutA n=1 Tax=Aestuariimicrobium sp. Y1814 TaxID=3418742 RepID=UPI003DA77D19